MHLSTGPFKPITGGAGGAGTVRVEQQIVYRVTRFGRRDIGTPSGKSINSLLGGVGPVSSLTVSRAGRARAARARAVTDRVSFVGQFYKRDELSRGVTCTVVDRVESPVARASHCVDCRPRGIARSTSPVNRTDENAFVNKTTFHHRRRRGAN